MNNFEIVKTIFGKAKIIKADTRTDSRGPMTVHYSDDRIGGMDPDFVVKEVRTYTMPRTGTFFGIHFQAEEHPGSKIISLIKGKGLDIAIDLRPDSPTYLKWESTEISAENCYAAYIPAGIGHAFISLTDDVIMLYQTDFHGGKGVSGRLNYRNEGIGLKLPIPIAEIADYDNEAPMEL